MRPFKFFITSVVLGIFLSACSARDGSNLGTVQIAFANLAANLNAIENRFFNSTFPSFKILEADGDATPAVFGVKLVVAYLVEDMDPDTGNNVGMVNRIWTNPVCDADLTHCNITSEAGQYRVTDYFNLALSSDEVNANLNSQRQKVASGTYKYIRVDFTGPIENPDENTDPNMQFAAAENDTPVEVRWRNGYLYEIAEPIVIAEGESFTATLSYDIANHLYTSSPAAPTGENSEDYKCDDNTTPTICMEGPTITVSATKN